MVHSNSWNQSIFHLAQLMLHAWANMTKAAKLTIKWSRLRGFAFLGFSFVSAMGCASFPPPTETMAEAIASVRGAEEVGAEQVPVAALQLQLAREEIAKARKLMAEGEHEPAYYEAMRAAHDAELAIALVRETEARNVAKQAEQSLGSAETTEVEVNP
jgi:hypothetical protein